MKQSYTILFAIMVALGLCACDSGDPTIEEAPAAVEASASDAMEATEEVAEQAMGTIDEAVEAMTEAGEEAMDDAADMLEDITTE